MHDVLLAFVRRWIPGVTAIDPTGAIGVAGGRWRDRQTLCLDPAMHGRWADLGSVVHEILHYLIASPGERELANWGLEDGSSLTAESRVQAAALQLEAFGVSADMSGRFWFEGPGRTEPAGIDSNVLSMLAEDIKTTVRALRA